MWRVAPGQQLAWRGWDDEFVLYNNLSGDTHLLDSDMVALLDVLRAGPCHADTLCAAFRTGLDPDELAALPATLADTLHRLHALHLVEPC